MIGLECHETREFSVKKRKINKSSFGKEIIGVYTSSPIVCNFFFYFFGRGSRITTRLDGAIFLLQLREKNGQVFHFFCAILLFSVCKKNQYNL